MVNDKPREFIVTVPRLEGVDEDEWKAYIQDAVGSMKGCMRPEEPITELKYDQVQVRRYNPGTRNQLLQRIEDLKARVKSLEHQLGEQPCNLRGS